MKTGLIAVFLLALLATSAYAFDAVGNFKQTTPELVSGWLFKTGGVKGGPYVSITDCGKPAPKADGSYDCTAKNQTVNPLYGVVTNYNSARVESPPSNEYALTITVAPPSDLKMAMVITTVSKVTRTGRVTAATTIVKKAWSPDTKEGTRGFRNSRGEYVTTTIIAMN
jgi:hypothetical protein